MSNPLIKTIVRTRFTVTSRAAVDRQTKKVLRSYLQLSQGVSELAGSKPVKVPKMLGVDEEMREWSFFMLIRHNIIVNRAISANVKRLALGEPEPKKRFDPKSDVMPEPDCGPEQIAIFKSSVLSHLDAVDELDELRGTAVTNHPVFGPFDAHKWNCMFAFHLQIHLKQAESIRQAIRGN